MTHTETTNDLSRFDFIADNSGETTVPDGYRELDDLLTTDGNVTKLSCPCGGNAAVVVDGTLYTAPESHLPDFLVLNLLIEHGIIDENDVPEEVKDKVAMEYVQDMVRRAIHSNGSPLGAMLGGFGPDSDGNVPHVDTKVEDNYVPGTYL